MDREEPLDVGVAVLEKLPVAIPLFVNFFDGLVFGAKGDLISVEADVVVEGGVVSVVGVVRAVVLEVVACPATE